MIRGVLLISLVVALSGLSIGRCASKAEKKQQVEKEIELFRNGDQPFRPFKEVEVMTDDGRLTEESAITEKFVKRARKKGAYALLIDKPIESGTERAPFQGFKITYLFRARAISYTEFGNTSATNNSAVANKGPYLAAGRVSPKGSGTGFFITEDGYLITNEHVVRKARLVQIRYDGRLLDARVIKTDPANDFAVLKVSGGFKALPVASSRGVKLGDSVTTIGFPMATVQGFEPKLTKGEISSLAGLRDDPREFQISNPIQPGNSGGALVDRAGNVVGVVVAKLSDAYAIAHEGTIPQNVNYAVKSTFLRAFLESVPGITEDTLPQPKSGEANPDEVIKHLQSASVMVLVY